MTRGRVRGFSLIALFSLIIFSLTGCGSDSSGPDESDTGGDIHLDPNPDSIDAGWTLTSSSRFSQSGNGDNSITNLSVGEYTVTWDGESGWITPDSQTQTLADGGSLTFESTYQELGSIQVDVDPDDIGASWILTGPDGFSESGFNDETLDDLQAGEYSIEWGNVTGWQTPENSDGTLVEGGNLVFDGTYTELELTGTIQIDPNPDYLFASWPLTGPASFSETGNGDTSLTDLGVGDYTVSWGAVVGWLAPPDEMVTLADNGSEILSGEYTELGAIQIDPDPDEFDAPWSLTGPESYSNSGEGDASLPDLLPGEYTLVWGAVSGWFVPAEETKTLLAGDDLTFSATYYEQGTVATHFVQISEGVFMMGSPVGEMGGASGERPYHEVNLTHGFYLQATEVTNQHFKEMVQWAYDNGHITATSDNLYDALDDSTEELLKMDSSFCDIIFSDGVFNCINPDQPVNELSWYGAISYCDWLSLQAGLPRAYDHETWLCNGGSPYTAQGFRLPTEAEWEYACRAGSVTAFANGPITDLSCEDPVLDEIAWYCGNSWYEGGSSSIYKHPAMERIPNDWGLYDMHGNVFEWCNDWWLDDYYETSPDFDPVGPLDGTYRAVRSSFWSSYARNSRSATRGRANPDIDEPYLEYVGFRPARTED